MSQPSIAIINFSSILSDTDVQTAIRAVNRQIVEDFVPTWGTGRILRLHAAAFTPNSATPLEAETVNADSVLYLVDESTLAGALGYHDLNTSDLPFGFVFVETSGPEWTITLSHEALELIVDPTVNLLVPGPDPRQANNTVLHSYEACDAVERTSYSVDGILVSNFVTPNYFTPGDAPGTRNDFLGIGVESLKATPGSHIQFYDLASNDWITWFGTASKAATPAAARLRLFERNKPARPSEEKIQAILEAAKRKPMATGCAGLPRMHAVTRKGRYVARIMGAVGKGRPVVAAGSGRAVSV
jgi:hypothetical protein